MRNNNNSGGLITLLTVLLATCVIAEAGIASYVGVTMQINRRANEEAIVRYEEYQEQRQQERDEPAAIDYVGPNLHIKDGQAVRANLSQTATAQPVTVKPEPEQTPETAADPEPVQQNEPQPAKEPEAQPAKPSEQSKSSAETPKAADSGNKASSAQKPSNGGGDSVNASKPADAAKASGGSAASIAGPGSSGSRVTTKNLDGTYKHDFSGGRVLGTKTSDKYHNSDCIGARKIPPENEVWYSSVADAVAAGRESCGSCYR